MREKNRYLATWAKHLADAARQGALTGKPCLVTRIETIAGPRAGALEIFAGIGSGHLLRALGKDQAALLRQFVPWHFVGDPQVFMSGRCVRIEAGWPSELAERVIRLGNLCDKPMLGGRWVAGKSETGATIVPALNDATPHFLFAGATGSGKSVALRSAALQLSRDPDNEMVLMDGKMGDSLRRVERLPGVLAPCAIEAQEIRAALGWVAAQMRSRYEVGYHDKRLIILYDEFQEQTSDDVIADLLRKVAAQGRGTGVHLLAATQHPTVDAFGDNSTRRNFPGKIALRVGDPDASRVAVGGSSPRADWLLGAGDSYTVAPGACHRVQLAYVDEQEITAGENGERPWRFTRWPDYNPEEIGRELPEVGWSYTGAELAVSIVSAANSEGRPAMVNRLKEAELGSPGAERAIRLLGLGRDANDWLLDNGFAVCLSCDTLSGGKTRPILPDVW